MPSRDPRTEGSRPSLLIVTTSPVSVDKLLTGQLRFLNLAFDVAVASSSGPEVPSIEEREGVPVYVVPMGRRPAPLRDLLGLFRMIFLLRRLRPDIVHAYTPKAGLLAMVAAKLVGTPIRVRSVNGLPLMVTSGLKRLVLTCIERVSCWAATDVLANSHGLRDYFIENVWSGPVGIIGSGSTNGIDMDRFRPLSTSESARLRASLGVSPASFVVLFIGRIVADKGVSELVEAFTAFSKSHGEAFLMLVGSHENDDPVSAAAMRSIRSDRRIVEVGWVDDVRPYLAIANTLVLPSYREGLPNVLLQAACYGLPIIASDIPGNTDIIRDGDTGLLVPPRDPAALARAISRIATDHHLALALGKRANSFVAASYSQPSLWRELARWYSTRIGQ